MKMQAYIAGSGMTRFGKFQNRGLKSLAAEAIDEALKEACIDRSEIQAVYSGTGAAGVMTGQVVIPGEVVVRGMGIGRVPVINVENACATSSTAFQQAATMITLGVYDVVLVVGFEKLFSEDKKKTFSVFSGGVDVEDQDRLIADLAGNMVATGSSSSMLGAGSRRSLFMDVYAAMARNYMQETGATRRHFAMVSEKSSFHGSLNPKAQYRDHVTVQEVLDAPLIVDPLTMPMCAPIGDGAAALVLVSKQKARALGLKDKVRVMSSVLATGWDYASDEREPVAQYTARKVYEESGVDPGDIDVVELHDAAAPAEIIYYEYLGLARKGEGVALLESGATRLGGRVPVNPSGGLLRKGHPIGASGCAQLVELSRQLRGQCDRRQVEGAQTALAENGGGYIGSDVAAIVVTLLQREG